MPVKSEAAPACRPAAAGRALLPTARTGRSPGCPSAARRNRGARGRADQPLAIVQGAAQKKFRWRRPRHTLKGRQVAAEVERVGLRLRLRKQQAEAGDIVLLYGDESEALTHPYLARAWAKTGADLRVPAPGQAKKVAMLGSYDPVTRQLVVIPAAASAAATSSPISNTWTGSMVPGRVSRSNRWC